MVRNELGLKQQTFRKESTDTLLLFPSSDGTGMVCYDLYARGGFQPYFPTEPPSTVAPTTSTPAPPRPRRSYQEIFQQRSNEASFFIHIQKVGGFLVIFYVLYSTLLHGPPLRFHCVRGCMLGSNPGLLRLWQMAIRKYITFFLHSAFIEKFKTF